MAADSLIALYWTSSGPVEVHFGREWSLFSWRERCEQAARVGFSGLGLWHADLEHLLETQDLAELNDIFASNGLRDMELEFLGDWFLDPDDERRRAADKTRALLFEAAVVLPAHHIKVGNIVGTRVRAASASSSGFGELCADAARYTDAKVVYEFMPYDVQVNDIDTALAVVEGADAPNGGLAFDTWHLGKLRLEPDDLRRIPERFVSWVELCDGPYEYAEDRARRGRSTTASCPARASSPSPSTSPSARARLRRPLGSRGALGGAPQPAHRADLRPRVRDDDAAASSLGSTEAT